MHRHVSEYEKQARLAQEMGIVSEQEWRSRAGQVVEMWWLIAAVFGVVACVCALIAVVKGYAGV
jgi:hypothetical protein